MKIFAIVATYNGSRWVDFCFSSLAKSNYPIKTIAVDNNSSDGTVDLIATKYPEVELISSKENLGFGKANNKAISLALQQGADYVFLLNQDAAIEKDTVECLVVAAEKNKQFGIISPLHFNGTGSALDLGFANCIRKEYSDNLLSFEKTSVYPIEFINAAAWLVSSNCLEKVGGFNPFFFHYGEDRDYVQRVKYCELKMGFVSNCKIFHDRESRDSSMFFSSFKKITWYYRISLKVRLTDVNHSFFAVLTKSLFWLAKEMAFHFFKGRWFAIGAWFSVWNDTAKEIKAILHVRKQIKTKATFLFLDKT